MPKLSIIVHNVRSSHNVGSILRTADGLGIDHVYLTGYTPYPLDAHDTRLPHEAQKIAASIHKTALGAEHTVSWSQHTDITQLTSQLKESSTRLIAIEQHADSTELQDFLDSYTPQDTSIIVGNEITGLEPEVLQIADNVVEIEMQGLKESFNVSVAAALALYQFKIKFTS